MYKLYVYLRRGRPVCIKALQEYTQHILGVGGGGVGRGAAPPSRRGAAGPGIAGERGLPPCPCPDDQRRRASEETVTIETLARCNSWLVDVVRAKYGRL